jgi:hypothetical protein
LLTKIYRIFKFGARMSLRGIPEPKKQTEAYRQKGKMMKQNEAR